VFFGPRGHAVEESLLCFLGANERFFVRFEYEKKHNHRRSSVIRFAGIG
jgi:hypothetical protein